MERRYRQLQRKREEEERVLKRNSQAALGRIEGSNERQGG